MSEPNQPGQPELPRRRYRWPWFVLLAFVAAVALAALWLSFEIRRTERIRDLNAPSRAQ